MSAILKRHCYHRNGNDVIFVNNFQLLEDCSIYVVQFLSSNKKPLLKKLNLNHDFVIYISKIVGSHLKLVECDQGAYVYYI
jgi:hypothetical protein